MESKFTIKDLFIFVLLLAVLISTWLAMNQFDRQWDDVQKIRGGQEDLTRDVAELRRMIEQGVVVSQGNSEKPAPENDPFARARAAREADDFAMGDWLVDAFGSQINTLTPLVSSDAYASLVQGQVLESLGSLDEDTLEWRPLLAQSWTVEDNSEAYEQWVAANSPKLREQIEADPQSYQEIFDTLKERAGENADEDALRTEAIERTLEKRINESPDRPVPLIVTFTLRDGITFSDGVAITAEDVEFTFNMIMNPKVAAPRQRSYYSQTIESVKARDLKTVVVTFKRPYFEAFDLAASISVLPQHYYGPIIAEDPETFNQSKGLLVGSGPYMLEDPKGWEPSDQIVLVRNERYWGVPGNFDRLVFRLYTDSKARLAAFKNQEIDMLGASPGQYVELLEDESLMARADNYEYMTPYNGYRYIAWNQRNSDGTPSPFADKRVRKAMTLLIDRQLIIDRVQLGYGDLCTGPFNPLGQQNSPNVQPWPHDPQQAKQLLAEAGFLDRNNDGAIEGPDGKPLKFKLTYPSGNELYNKMVLIVKDSMATAGVIVEPDPLEWSVMVERLNNRNFQAITLGWTSGPETDINQMFHSDGIQPGGDNFMAYESRQLDALIEKARHTVDVDQRMKLWHRCHEIIHDDQPYTFLSWNKSLRFIDKRFKNIQLLRAGLNPRSEWYVPRNEQRWTR